MSPAGWYFEKAAQCGRMAEAAADPQQRASYEAEQKNWLDIANGVVRDAERFSPRRR
jgi:hypothetical protein